MRQHKLIRSWSRVNVVTLVVLVVLVAVGGYAYVRFGHAATTYTLTSMSTQLPASEASGLVPSRLYPDVYWWHRDGGQTSQPRDAVWSFKMSPSGQIEPFSDGTNSHYTLFPPPATTTTTDYNNNWEDIAMDTDGNILVGDIGANKCGAKNQYIYKIAEPNPSPNAGRTGPFVKYNFTFPDPPAGCNTYNSEAMFWVDNNLYIIAKNWNDGAGSTGNSGRVYRFSTLQPGGGQLTLTYLGDLGGGITQQSVSAVSSDRTRFVVAGHLTMNMFKMDPTKTGDAWVKQALGANDPAWTAKFNCVDGTTDCKETVEGGSFVPGTHNVIFVSESRYMYFAKPADYGDSSANPTPTPTATPTPTPTHTPTPTPTPTTIPTPTKTPTPTPTPTTGGDVNGDAKINIVDLSLLNSHWGINYPAADFNHDGTVGIVDLSILLSHWTG